MNSRFLTTSTQTENDWLHMRMTTVAECEKESTARNPLIREILQHLVEARTIAGWGCSLGRKFRLLHEPEDVHQVIAASLAVFLSTVTADQVTRMRQQYIQQLWNVASRGVKTYQEGAAYTGLSGFTGITRRQKLITRAKIELAQKLHRDPTNEEIKWHVNTHMLATRKNAVKQGVLIQDADFRSRDLVSMDSVINDDDALQLYGLAEDNKAAAGFLQVEVDEAMRALIAHMRDVYPGDQDVVHCTIAWAMCVLAGEEPTAARIQLEVQCGLRIAQNSINRLREQLPSFSARFDGN